MDFKKWAFGDSTDPPTVLSTADLQRLGQEDWELSDWVQLFPRNPNWIPAATRPSQCSLCARLSDFLSTPTHCPLCALQLGTCHWLFLLLLFEWDFVGPKSAKSQTGSLHCLCIWLIMCIIEGCSGERLLSELQILIWWFNCFSTGKWWRKHRWSGYTDFLLGR